MRPPHPFLWRMLGVSALSMSVLTACPGDPPPYLPPAQLSFEFPAVAYTPDLRLAAVASRTVSGQTDLRVVEQGYLQPAASGAVSSGTISLYPYTLESLKNDPACTTPFLGGETQGMQEVTVTPNTVKTCNVYFLLFRDADRDGKPTAEEELYSTHDLYSYASAAFSYSFVSPDGHSTETGTRRAGWSLVAHAVLEPSATPDRFLVTMNSVPQADETIALRLHEPSDYFTSQGLNAGGRR